LLTLSTADAAVSSSAELGFDFNSSFDKGLNSRVATVRIAEGANGCLTAMAVVGLINAAAGRRMDLIDNDGLFAQILSSCSDWVAFDFS
jgi:hypothetical protein